MWCEGIKVNPADWEVTLVEDKDSCTVIHNGRNIEGNKVTNIEGGKVIWEYIENNIKKSKNYDIKWDLNEDIDTTTKYVKIWWNIDNTRIINTVSWDVEVSWNVEWDIITFSWSVDVIENLDWTIETISWEVEVGTNKWRIKTVSWDITVNKNTWIIRSTIWDIRIWEILIKINKKTNYWGISWGSVFNWDIVWGSSYITINWERVWKSEEFVATIDKITIDIKEWKILYEWSEISLKEVEKMWYRIKDDLKEVVYKWQKITFDNLYILNNFFV